METFPFYGDFTGTLLYGDSFFSRETFSLLSGDFFSLSMETFPLYGDFTGTLRGLFSMETFSLYGDFFFLYGDFSSLRRLYGDFTGTLLYGNFSLSGDFTGTLRGLFSMETFFLSLETFSLSLETFSLYFGDRN